MTNSKLNIIVGRKVITVGHASIFSFMSFKVLYIKLWQVCISKHDTRLTSKYSTFIEMCLTYCLCDEMKRIIYLQSGNGLQ